MTSAFKNNLAIFPELQDLLDYISSHPNYGNIKVRDISSKSSKWVLSPAQMSVLQKEWAFLKSSGGKSPYDINCEKWPDLDLFDKFWEVRDPMSYKMSDEMINSILSQAKSRPLSDKQLDVLKKRWESESSVEYIEHSDREIENLDYLLKAFHKLSSAHSNYPYIVEEMLKKMKSKKYTSADESRLFSCDHEHPGAVYKYKKMVFTYLFK